MMKELFFRHMASGEKKKPSAGTRAKKSPAKRFVAGDVKSKSAVKRFYDALVLKFIRRNFKNNNTSEGSRILLFTFPGLHFATCGTFCIGTGIYPLCKRIQYKNNSFLIDFTHKYKHTHCRYA